MLEEQRASRGSGWLCSAAEPSVQQDSDPEKAARPGTPCGLWTAGRGSTAGVPGAWGAIGPWEGGGSPHGRWAAGAWGWHLRCTPKEVGPRVPRVPQPISPSVGWVFEELGEVQGWHVTGVCRSGSPTLFS